MIYLNDIEVRFGDFTALKDINIHVKEGEFYTFLGPSGCGKTTTLRTITGFIEPAKGTVKVKGKDITHVPVEKRNIGMVFQNYALFPTMSVYENIAFGLKVKKVNKTDIDRRVKEMAGKVDLTEQQLMRKVAELSGGQQQRVAIARALVTNPEIICLDEPLSNLDAKLRVQLREELKEMQAKFGITTVYVTHDQEEALTLSDCIAVFNKGFIEQIGTPDEIYSASKTEFVCNFIGDINKLNANFTREIGAQTGKGVDAGKNAYVRLERIHVNSTRTDGRAVFKGKVAGSEYFGLYIKYQLDVNGQVLKCIDKNDGRQYLRKGEEVEVSIDPRDLMVY
ncbi:MAG: ABC transporter ATP-binding protein [Clostridia bacterium]|nr:ABC transporter ATP-binding protein [Clostridia bacterium]MBQ8972362.1 ABC transporter ATP-binding protein [Clostridia bacterium]